MPTMKPIGPDERARPPDPVPCAKHWWYWVGPFTLKCRHCGAVKIAER
jgi:hypothetical protein